MNKMSLLLYLNSHISVYINIFKGFIIPAKEKKANFIGNRTHISIDIATRCNCYTIWVQAAFNYILI